VRVGRGVLGFEGLHVGDASLMPTIPRANTNLTVTAVAERLAEVRQARM
jgi:choline dehydrogenase-like flavoprotein